MEWALDQLGNPVSATEKALFRYGFHCGKCGEPVFKRTGAKRRPHFAHYGYSAKPECEFYHPPSGVVTTSGSGYAREGGQAASSGPSLQGGLFLARKERGNYSLYLKLVQLPAGTDGVIGEVEIRSGLGVRTYMASQLQRPRLVPVIPQLPVAEVIATGDMGLAGAAIKASVDMFRGFGNYFRGGETGRLLTLEEPLEWGESYRLLTQQALGPVLEFVWLEVVHTEDMRGWYVYEVTLPTLSQMESETGREALSRYLGRTIRAPRARAYFVDPPPHHIEPDGTYVFPQTTGQLVLRRTDRSHISIRGSEQAVALANVGELVGEWVSITGLGIGDFTVLLDGREELLGRFKECGLFQPRGVRVAVGDSAWEIFEPELRKAIRHGSYEDLRVECPSTQVAEYLALAQPVWAREGARFTLCGIPHGLVDADNFGSLSWPVPEGEGIEPPPIDAQTYARRVWLEGLVARLDSPDALMCLRKQWDKASPASYYDSAHRELSCLHPHIQFSRFG